MTKRNLNVVETVMQFLFEKRNALTLKRVNGDHTPGLSLDIRAIDDVLKSLKHRFGPQKKPLSAATPSDQKNTGFHHYSTTGARL